MSEAAKAARAANKAKANRLAAGDPKAKVDASSWTPPEMMNTEKKTGLRPISRRQFKRGGKVHGEAAAQNAGRKARKSGDLPTQIAESHVNRNVKEANAEFGKPHVGGYEKGGKTAKADGGAMGDPRAAAADRMAAANAQSGVPAGRMTFVPRSGSPLPGSGMKKGGRTGKAAGGAKEVRNAPVPRPKPRMDDYNDQDITPTVGSVNSPEFKAAQRRPMIAPEAEALIRSQDPAYVNRPAPYKKGGKAGKWEGSAKDEAQDKKLAKKRGMSMKAWEASEGDEKHDEQRSMKGLKSGGHVDGCKCALCRTAKASGGALSGNYTGGTRPTGGRIARAEGGKAKKGKTNINIVINAGQKPTDPMAGLPPMMPPPPGGPGLPPSMSAMPPAPGGGAPMGPPPDGPAGGAPPGLAALLGRKAGGRVGNRSYSSYKDMDAGAGGGLGRLEKTEIAQKTYRK